MSGWHVRLAKDAALYGGASVVVVVGGLITVPLFTHALTPHEFGILELINRLADVFTLVVFLGVRQAFIRFYFDSEDAAHKQRVTATYLAFIAISVSIVVVLAVAAGAVLGFDRRLGVAPWVLWTALAWITCEAFLQVLLNHAQIEKRPGRFFQITALRTVLLLLIAALLLYGFHSGLGGVFVANLIASASLALPGVLLLVVWSGVRIDRKILRGMIVFGLPYLPTAALGYVMNNSDRYFIGALDSLSSLGVYSLAAKLGMMGTLLLMETFMKVWGPFIFEVAHRDEGPVQIATVFKVFASCTAWAALTISVLAPTAVRLVAGKQFLGAYTLVPVLALASIFYALQIVSDGGILITKQTRYKPLTFAVGAAVAVTIGYFATKFFGAYGAAWSVVASNLSVFWVTFAISNRLYPLPLNFGHLARIVIPAVAIVSVFYAVGFDSSHILIQLAAATLAIVLYPVVVVALKVFSHSEQGQARELFDLVRRRIRGATPDSGR